MIILYNTSHAIICNKTTKLSTPYFNKSDVSFGIGFIYYISYSMLYEINDTSYVFFGQTHINISI